MKIFILLSLCLSHIGYAGEDLRSFQEELLSEVNSEIQKDDFYLKKKTSAGRGPASVKQHPRFESAPKIDKNVKQLGHADW